MTFAKLEPTRRFASRPDPAPPALTKPRAEAREKVRLNGHPKKAKVARLKAAKRMVYR